MRLLFWIDYECAGGVPSLHGFTQVGVKVFDIDARRPLDITFSMYSNMKGYTWEQRCVTEFWEQNPDRYAQTKDAVANAPFTCSEVTNNELIPWMQAVAHGHKSILCSDNVAYDIGILKFFSTIDIMYIFGEYTSILDVNCMYLGMYLFSSGELLSAELLDKITVRKEALRAARAHRGLEPSIGFPDFGVSHDHHPENDAETMGYRWAHVQGLLLP